MLTKEEHDCLSAFNRTPAVGACSWAVGVEAVDMLTGEPLDLARKVSTGFRTCVRVAIYHDEVGSNRRYADGLQRKRFNREAEAHALVPRSLSDVERGPDAVQRGEPVAVKAWVDYGNASAQVLGSAVAWTRRAVCVVWTDSHDQEQEAWLWAGAVERSIDS